MRAHDGDRLLAAELAHDRPSARVIGIGSPIGRHPCATMVSTAMSPAMATPTAPTRCTLPPDQSAFCPGPLPPDASPPTLRPDG